jgi:RND superfamily putative drug exporter
MLAVGMAVAVLIDASLVRMILVPALMAILDRRAWWLPVWLDRIIPDLKLEGAEPEPTEPPAEEPRAPEPPAPEQPAAEQPAAPEQPPAAPAVPAPPS